MQVVSNTAVSLDGRINTRERRFTFFGSARDHARMSRLRTTADAVLVGGATFRNWPHPALPDDGDRALLTTRPWNVVVTRSLAVPLDSDFLREPAVRPLFVTRAASVPRDFPAEVEAWPGEGDPPVRWIVERLAARGIKRLLVEAGGDLLFQFLAADALDEMHVTLCPIVVGGDAPSLADGAGFDRADVRRLQLVASEVEGDEIFLHYRNLRGDRA
ncbi:MAG TPA: dihydrofolate reductase family protein [Caldimonas sp.]|nr:dihydrofolate reductase family protein [Caldimonas sp.]HEX4235352.1 dihydrofolate reductase family protein [Caldimonas sp.]